MESFKSVIANRIFVLALAYGILVIAMLLNLNVAYASPQLLTYYVAIDFENNTGYAYDENFIQQPDRPINPDQPDDPKSSIVILPKDKPFWYLGSDVDIVRRNADESIDILSADPAYSEMIHHMVWAYTAPKRTRKPQCLIDRLIPVGSELLSFHFPRGYGYKMDSGVLVPIFDWKNPANKAANEKIYLRFNITVDDAKSGYRDTNVDWVDQVECLSAFSLPPGKSKIISKKYPVSSDRRIIAVQPHIHDHGGKIKLKSNAGTIRKFIPDFQNFPVMHYDMGQGPVLLHRDGEHLPIDGLSIWTPGVNGPIIKAGDELWVESSYFNPHNVDIDNMLIAIIFWEAIQ